MSEERLQKILRLIESSRTITAKELEAQLYVSSATIRRDLAELSRQPLEAEQMTEFIRRSMEIVDIASEL